MLLLQALYVEVCYRFIMHMDTGRRYCTTFIQGSHLAVLSVIEMLIRSRVFEPCPPILGGPDVALVLTIILHT